MDFIGRNYVEVVCDKEYKLYVVECLRQYKMRYKPKACPFTGFVSRYQSDNLANRILVNTTRLLNRCNNLLMRIDHPQAREFYGKLKEQAETAIRVAVEKGAEVSEEVLKPGNRACAETGGGGNRTKPVSSHNKSSATAAPPRPPSPPVKDGSPPVEPPTQVGSDLLPPAGGSNAPEERDDSHPAAPASQPPPNSGNSPMSDVVNKVDAQDLGSPAPSAH